MRFYDALQLDPSILKRKIAACDTKDEKAYYWIAMAVRSILIVAFAIVFISLLYGIFGSENTPLAVAMFCMMLGAGIYGLQEAVILRIVDTFLGVVFGLVFAAIFHRLAAVRLLPSLKKELSDQESGHFPTP